jgi:hypothetical protein
VEEDACVEEKVAEPGPGSLAKDRGGQEVGANWAFIGPEIWVHKVEVGTVGGKFSVYH